MTNRRSFLRDASAFASAGVGCLSFGGLGQVFARPAARQVLRIPSRPFNMLAFGDSIMWGQGLTENLKFATLVKDWVNANMLGRAVTFENFAHSGARLMPDTTFDAVAPFAGEVPAPYPSIHKQLNRALDSLKLRSVTASEIDLVLLNGGINDMGITSILNPFASSGSIRDLTRDSIMSRMNYVLPEAIRIFPNAKFIVPGYFPIVTYDSSTEEVTALLSVLFGLAGLALTPFAKQQLIANCDVFYAESDSGLRSAVTAQNERTPNRCVYADPGFSAYNGYGASQRYLFNIAESDPMLNTRQTNCAAAGQSLDALCLGASMGHPNVNGAIKYANAMTAKLGTFLTEWQALRKLFACLEPKPVIGVATTYTVWVEDAVTRLPVSASVTVGTQTVSANTSFTHTFACTASGPETIDGPRGRPGRTITPPPACDRIVITAPDYVQLSIR